MSFYERTLAAPLPPRQLATSFGEFQWLKSIPFFLMHLLPFGALFTGARWQDFAVCFALYFARMFGVTGGYHRYFAHRTYKTSRVFQFLLALLAQSSAQKGALWWAAHHRTHHKYSDKPEDPHNSRRGFWYSHVGWILDRNDHTDYTKVKDLAKFPELVFLNVYPNLPTVALGVGVWWLLGWSGLFIGFGLSTVLCWHGTFTINSLAHMIGKPRYDADDESKNSLILALITMGEGWHNNHHYFMGSTRQGFYWWEIDMSYYIIKVFSWLRLVWDVKAPPARVYDPNNMLPNAKPSLERDEVPPAAAVLPSVPPAV